MQNNRLGKGISSLLDDYSYNFEEENGSPAENKVLQVDISLIQPNPSQPRKNFDSDSLAELAASIKSTGIIQPLIAERVTDDKYSLIAGERRFRAAKLAGLKKVPVILGNFDEIQRLEISLVENIQRENLNPVEEARAYQYLLTEKELTQEELSEKVGKSRSTIANSVRILQLPPKVREALETGEITSGHARALLSVVNPADCQILFGKILKESLSVRQAEHLARELNKGKRISVTGGLEEEKASRQKNEEILAVEEKFLSVTGTKVQLKGNIKKGKIEIPYSDSEELERIYQLFDPSGSLFGDNTEEF